MRWVLCALIAVACSGEKKPKQKKVVEQPPPPDALVVSSAADRDALFVSVPTVGAVESVIGRLAKVPHVAGTPANEAVGKEIAATLGRMGWKIGVQQYDVFLPHPKKLSITVDGAPISTAEPAAAKYGDDPTYLGWNAYSASGKARGAIVDAGYGTPEELAKAKGKIAVVRYGPSYRGVPVANAERAGAAAVILWNDPKDDAARPRDSLQRGTVLYYWQRTGDPLTPGVAALPGAPRAKPADVDVLPKIPVVNVTAIEAEKLLAGKTAEVVVEMDTETRPIRNVIAFLPGASKQAVILGNHYDAWGPGALDPHSGTAALIEIARGLTALSKAGWKPRRTIILGFWDAEEMGVIGSTEWVEEQMATLRENAVAYFNIDTIKAAELVVTGSPALHAHVRGCAGDVTNPATGKPFAPAFKDMGIGSDFTPFLHHAGVASLQWQTGGGPGKYHVWHSMLDDAEYVKTAADPGFAFIPAYAKVMGLCAVRLADAEHLPHDYAATAEWIAGALAKFPTIDRTRLDAALATLRAPIKPSAACDAALVVAERGFLDDKGIAGRPWYRHLATGPDPANGYGALLVPELAAAKDDKARAVAADRLAAAIERVAAALAPCR